MDAIDDIAKKLNEAHGFMSLGSMKPAEFGAVMQNISDRLKWLESHVQELRAAQASKPKE